MKPSIAVCILFYQKLGQTIECIDSFLDDLVNIYVLNNGSDEKSFLELQKRFHCYSNVFFYDAGENLGPARGRNVLISKVKEQWIVFADNDITVEPIDWLSILLDYIKVHRKTDVFLPKVFNVHEESFAQMQPFYLKNREVFDYDLNDDTKSDFALNWFPSGACIVRKKFFNEVGLFDDNLFAFEDYEMGIRCIMFNRIININLINDIIFRHDHKFQAQQKDKTAVLERYNSEKLNNSFKYIEEKFNIKFNHKWEYWTKSQINLMTKTKQQKLVKRIVNNILKIFR